MISPCEMFPWLACEMLSWNRRFASGSEKEAGAKWVLFSTAGGEEHVATSEGQASFVNSLPKALAWYHWE